MANILRLVRKDAGLLARFFVLLVVGELLLVFTLGIQMRVLGDVIGSVCSIAGCIGGFLICFRSIVMEEKNRAFQFIRLLPVSTLEIVLAKYLANLMLVTLNAALLFVVVGFSTRAFTDDLHPSLEMAVFPQFLAGQVLVNTLFVAVAMTLGSEKAIWVPFALLFAFFNVLLNLDTLGLRGTADLVIGNSTRFCISAALFVVAAVAVSAFVMKRRRVFG